MSFRVSITTTAECHLYLLFPLQATELSKLRSEVSRARADLKVAESRLALLQQSPMPREDVQKAVSRFAGQKVGAVRHSWPCHTNWRNVWRTATASALLPSRRHCS